MQIFWGNYFNGLNETKTQAHKIIANNTHLVSVSYLRKSENESSDNGGDYSDYNFRSNGNNVGSGSLANEVLKDFVNVTLTTNSSSEAMFEIVNIGEDDDIIKPHFNSVDGLSQPVKQEAIRIARDILDKLRIQFASNTIDGLMKDQNNDAKTVKLFDAVGKVAIIFNNHAQVAEKLAPELLEDEDVKAARDILGVFKYNGVKLQLRPQAIKN
jgi:hypothetical protein